MKTDEHGSIIGYTRDVYRKFGVMSSNDLDISRHQFFQLIDRSGTVIDLGCGCGWFLQYLVENSMHVLTPYGVDISEEAIHEAKTEVLPEFASNFYVADIEDFKLVERFDFIIVNPLYIGQNFEESFEAYFENLKEGGKLILMITSDTLPRMKMWNSMWSYLKSKNLKWMQTSILTYGYITKNGVVEENGIIAPIRVKDLLK